MQEGTVAFLQMVKIAAAVTLHERAHLPYLVYLRHPTTGGVFASWGSLGHVTIAQPGALVGFLGPRVDGRSTTNRFRSASRRRRICTGTALSTRSPRSASCAASSTRVLNVVADDAAPAPDPPPPRATARCAGLGLGGGVTATGPAGGAALLRHGCTEQVLRRDRTRRGGATLLALARFAGGSR